jgi:hypothetical protein
MIKLERTVNGELEVLWVAEGAEHVYTEGRYGWKVAENQESDDEQT